VKIASSLALALPLGFAVPVMAQVPSVAAWEIVIREQPQGMCNRARQWNYQTGTSYNDFLVKDINRLLQEGNTLMANSAIAEGRIYRKVGRGVF
jgi:hypothetical protein